MRGEEKEQDFDDYDDVGDGDGIGEYRHDGGREGQGCMVPRSPSHVDHSTQSPPRAKSTGRTRVLMRSPTTPSPIKPLPAICDSETIPPAWLIEPYAEDKFYFDSSRCTIIRIKPSGQSQTADEIFNDGGFLMGLFEEGDG